MFNLNKKLNKLFLCLCVFAIFLSIINISVVFANNKDNKGPNNFEDAKNALKNYKDNSTSEPDDNGNVIDGSDTKHYNEYGDLVSGSNPYDGGYYNSSGNFVEFSGTAKYVKAGVITAEEAKDLDRARSEVAAVANNPLDPKNEALNNALVVFIGNIRYIIAFLSGFGALSAIVIFIVLLVQLSSMPAHPTQRRHAMEKIITSIISIILLGGITTFMTVFYNTFIGFINSFSLYSKNWKAHLNIILYEYRGIVTGIFGVATLSMILMFFKNFIQLGASSGNPSARKQAITGVLLTGLATTGLGAITIFVGIFWNLI